MHASKGERVREREALSCVAMAAVVVVVQKRGREGRKTSNTKQFAERERGKGRK